MCVGSDVKSSQDSRVETSLSGKRMRNCLALENYDRTHENGRHVDPFIPSANHLVTFLASDDSTGHLPDTILRAYC